MFLASFAAWGAVVELPAGERNAPRSPPLEWVRTADGWEKPAAWQAAPEITPPLHPAVVAAFFATSGMFVLLAPPARRGS